MSTEPRLAAVQSLLSVSAGQSLNQVLASQEPALAAFDRPLWRELCYGSLRQWPLLAGLLQQLLQKPLRSKDQDIYCVLVLGLYQLRETRIPDHAAVDTSVTLCRRLKKPWAGKLVNGVLRQYLRHSDELLAKLEPAALQAHPAWLYQLLAQYWPAQLADILQANNSHPPMCLRVNRLRSTRENYLPQLIDASACSLVDSGIRLTTPVPVEALPGFAEGVVSVQDEAAQLAATLLDLQPGQRVLDACCAPGGKTGHILETEPGLAELVALDSVAARLEKVQENLQRLQLQATLRCGDAAATADWWDGELFDRILVDAPCSATGVLRRNPDIKLHRRAGDIATLCQLQQQILQSVWSCLRPGGKLLYATCSVLPAENTEVIARFLAANTDARELPLTGDWGLHGDHGRQLLPSAGGSDGFYYALLTKTANNS